MGYVIFWSIVAYILICYVINFIIVSLMYAIHKDKIHDYATVDNGDICGKQYSWYHITELNAFLGLSPISIPVVISFYAITYGYNFLTQYSPQNCGKWIRGKFLSSLKND